MPPASPDGLYAIALGSNRPGRHGPPAAALRAAAAALGEIGRVEALSRIRATPALGPAGRSFANAALLLRTPLTPPALLAALKALERRFGRRGGRRWGPRVLDLDILLWSGGAFCSGGLVVPHPAFRVRAFALQPLAEIAPGWRDPLTGASMRQLLARLARPVAVDRRRRRS
jgi:2-amino-4-hydroxy-6-hydroxymethyldihydropteridine diphosphokinase